MSLNLVTLLYLFASVCFIQALKGLSHPTTSIRGNLFGMVGMGVALVEAVKRDQSRMRYQIWYEDSYVRQGGEWRFRKRVVRPTLLPECVNAAASDHGTRNQYAL